MSKCHGKYASSTNKDDDCTTTSSSSPPSVHQLLRASAIVATAVFLVVTVILLICILHKRRMILFGRFRTNPGSRVQTPPALYVWSSPSAEPVQQQAHWDAAPALAPARAPNPKSASKGAAVIEPVSCVIMAGEERPTYLARPLPMVEFVDVSLDPRMGELERGKRKGSLNSSRGGYQNR